jgi:glyoxylase-like metal-dependent hydrolase (beta-lactamase superfamily II)
MANQEKRPMRLAPSLHRLGDRMVGVYLLEESGLVTIVDAGVPGYYSELPRELAAMGRTIDDVSALVLTHGQSDHLGFAERLRTEQGVPVSVHELDATLAKGEVDNPSPGIGERKLSSLLGFLLWSARRGALRLKSLTEVSTFKDGATLDVPGALQVMRTPGHTPGSVVLQAPSHDALLVGDAFSTYSVVRGVSGPQIAPFSADPDEALSSLSKLDDVEAHWVLPGHGDAWTDGVGTAVAAVRTAGVRHLAKPKT